MTLNFQFDAYQAHQSLRERYVEHLIEFFQQNDRPLAHALRALWLEDSGGGLFSDPLVEAAFGFRPHSTLPELSGANPTPERPLHPRTVELFRRAGMNYRLYDHQVEAIQAGARGDTVLVSAGTGSGKTEAFLIPLIDSMFWAQENGEDNLDEPGVRALVIYPLNALVNNQIQRLSEILAHQTDLTFAFYTSRLKETHRDVQRAHRATGRPMPPACQIMDRQSLRGLKSAEDRQVGPPHILVTNFSMLEYMLIRPLDRSIFLKRHTHFGDTPRLSSIVLDEAHVYTGSQASEIHMLLRRAARRFGSTLSSIQGYATSATLGDAGASSALEEFAANMFSTPPEDVSVILGKRWKADIERAESLPAEPELSIPETLPSIAPDLRTLDHDDTGAIVGFVDSPDHVSALVRVCKSLGLNVSPDSRTHTKPARFLHAVCSATHALVALRAWLFELEELPTLSEVAHRLYESREPVACRAAYTVLRLGSLARSSASSPAFIPTRLHQFVRAPTGVKIKLNDSDERSGWWGELESESDETTFELLYCEVCGAPYGQVWRSEDDWGDAQFAPDPDGGNKPSAFRPDPHGNARLHDTEVTVFALDHAGSIKSCVECETSPSRLRPMHTSPRHALGVIIDAIYPHLGAYPATRPRPGDGRRLLTFSDSRQEAARVAAQVEASHDRGLNRQLLYQTLSAHGELSGRDLVEVLEGSPALRQRAYYAEFADDDLEHIRSGILEDLARFSLYQEFARPPRHGTTLETLGLVEIVYTDLAGPPEQVRDWMTPRMWSNLLATVLDDARRRGCTDRFKEHDDAGRAAGLRYLLPAYTGRVLVWTTDLPEDDFDDENDAEQMPSRVAPLLPRTSHRNRSRVFRLAETLAATYGCDPVELLRAVWDTLKDAAGPGRPRWIKTRQEGDHLGIYIKVEDLVYKAHDLPSFFDPVDGRALFRSIDGKVADEPDRQALSCSEEMGVSWRRRHSVQRVRDSQPLGLWSLEHTAQIDVESLELDEAAFRTGYRNLLASSTTLEMGVDLGGLTAVLMTNVPPGPANYWQRGGRAGRRADGSSSVITLALDRAHDQLVFEDPRQFIHREILPPVLRLDGHALLQRHVNSFLLTAFFTTHVRSQKHGNPMHAFGQVSEFFVGAVDPSTIHGSNPGTMAAHFKEWLESLPSAIRDEVRHLVHDTALMQASVDDLVTRCAEALQESQKIVETDRSRIEHQLAEAQSEGPGRVDKTLVRALEHQLNSIDREHLISYLARTSFLPRFGFPLNVVKLDTRWNFDVTDERSWLAADLRMERTLDIALTEYAPGAEVIANKHVHTVRGIERNWYEPDSDIAARRYFLTCHRCGHVDARDSRLENCPICGADALDLQTVSARIDHAQTQGHDASESDSVAVVRRYLRPSGFAVKAGIQPRRLGDTGRRRRMPSASSYLKKSQPIAAEEYGPLEVLYCPGSRLFVRSEGSRSSKAQIPLGYAICQVCGFSEPEAQFGGPVPHRLRSHHNLRGHRKCPQKGQFWRNEVLGLSLPVDALSLRALNGSDCDRKIATTLSICLQLASAHILNVDPRQLRPTTPTRADGDSFRYDASIYEEAESGLLALLVEERQRLIEIIFEWLRRDDADFIRFENQYLYERGLIALEATREAFSKDL